MPRQLPPLNMLRVFEAAARHLSFTRAAEELHVTQAAVSHQVKALEEFLGVALFRRYNRRLVLTEAGQNYLPSLRDAFDLMEAATRRLGRDAESGVLKISTLHSFAARWLVPRVPRFHKRHPEIELSISTSTSLVDFRRDDVDVAVRVGRGNYPELHVVHLMDDYILPVCSPRLLDGEHPLRSAQDLKFHALLHDTALEPVEQAPSWRNWLRQAGVQGIDADRGTGYSDAGMAIQAAIAGHGVALARFTLVCDDLAAGHLVQPFGPTFPYQWSHYLVCPKAAADNARIRAFRDWLQDEIAQMQWQA
ncbi:MAG TPA: transcriptional regulator GcvA [Ferrovibrio sp.]|jgi:LysR family glycine cleavage system transcriptional activator|uniref:transcriptional regulator GcvA n=1 Tax=Ferrovibrio sp. TaxID=1917215 RepID=UPI002B4B692F|nr:transcriptional regulator GcvA [Ferrovibrio sp.]HLT76010.1 transcriptional regulator GcvA [Ferrovibrio sp.]